MKETHEQGSQEDNAAEPTTRGIQSTDSESRNKNRVFSIIIQANILLLLEPNFIRYSIKFVDNFYNVMLYRTQQKQRKVLEYMMHSNQWLQHGQIQR